MVREFDERNMARSRERCAAMEDMANSMRRCGEVRKDCEKGATTAATADAVFAMRHAVKECKADCHRYAERAFEDIDRARGLIEEMSYFKAADALYEAITDVHKAFLMGEIGLTYEKCAGWRAEDGDRHAD